MKMSLEDKKGNTVKQMLNHTNSDNTKNINERVNKEIKLKKSILITVLLEVLLKVMLRKKL